MNKLHLHSQGKKSHIKELNDEMVIEMRKISNNEHLSEIQKAEETKNLKEKYHRLKRISDFSLF